MLIEVWDSYILLCANFYQWRLDFIAVYLIIKRSIDIFQEECTQSTFMFNVRIYTAEIC